MEQIKLAAKPREAIGSKSVKRLRDEGKIPGVVYGRAFGDAVAIVIEARDLRAALSHGAHSVINLEIEGRGPTPVLLHDRQLDPVTKRLLHVDLHAVNLNEEVETTVRVVAVGTATGVKNGGILDIVMREITVAALPGSIPDHIDVDVRDLDITDAVHVRELPVIEGVRYVEEPDDVVIAVLPPSKVEEPVVAAVAEVPVEPELIGKKPTEEVAT
ncbi:MAG TPA: 50S ribosomal protein L25 [Candidatus Eremiobacteraceae bacterium]|jgi:large subunit ribosomal protein L25